MIYLVIISIILFAVILFFDKKRNIYKFFIYIIIFSSLLAILILKREHQSDYLIINNYSENVPNFDSIFVNKQYDIIHLDRTILNQSLIDNYESVILLGEGLDEIKRSHLKSKLSQFLPNDIYGVIDLEYPDEIYQDQPFKIMVHTNLKDTGYLFLKGLGEYIDSIKVEPDKQISFLNCQIKIAGQFLYSLQLKSSELSQDEKIAFDIRKKELKIFSDIYSLTPNWTYFQRFLQEQNHKLSSRIKLTNKDFKWINNSKDYNHQNMSRKLLESSDLLFFDLTAYLKQTNKQKRRLIQLSKEKPIILMLDEKIKSFKIGKETIRITKRVIEKNREKYKIVKPEQSNQIEIKQEETLVKLKGHFLYFISPLENYSLYLSGDKKEYSDYWRSVFQDIQLRKETDIILSSFIFQDQLNKVYLRSQNPSLLINNQAAATKRDLFESDLFFYNFIRNKETWLHFKSIESEKSVYLYNKNAWQSMRRHSLIEKTMQIERRDNRNIQKTNFPMEQFYIILFFLSIFGLWLYEKFN
jgi:hypothetical protein